MNTLTKSAPLGALGLPSGDHLVRFHVEGDTISFEVTSSEAQTDGGAPRTPTGFVEKWAGTVTRIDDPADAWLTHINEKHLR